MIVPGSKAGVDVGALVAVAGGSTMVFVGWGVLVGIGVSDDMKVFIRSEELVGETLSCVPQATKRTTAGWLH